MALKWALIVKASAWDATRDFLSTDFSDRSYTKLGLARDSFIGLDGNSGPVFMAGYARVLQTLKTDSGVWQIRANASATVDGKSVEFFNVREAYRDFNGVLFGGDTFTIGRRLRGWTELDTGFALGTVEPIFFFDPLLREPQGLTGVFYSIEESGLKIDAFASFLHFPNQGSSVEFVDGRPISGSPWIVLPPREVEFLGVPTPVRYRIQDYKVEDFLLRPSALARASLEAAQGLWVSVGGGTLPSNTISTHYLPRANLENLTGEFNISPSLSQRLIFFLESEISFGPHRFGVGSLSESFLEDKNIPLGYIPHRFQDSLTVYGFGELRYPRLGHFRVSLMSRSNQGNVEVDPILSGPYLLGQALSFLARSRIYELGLARVHYEAQYNHEFEGGGSHIRAFARAEWPTGVEVFGGFDILAAGLASRQNPDLFSRHSQNNRIVMGAGYVF